MPKVNGISFFFVLYASQYGVAVRLRTIGTRPRRALSCLHLRRKTRFKWVCCMLAIQRCCSVVYSRYTPSPRLVLLASNAKNPASSEWCVCRILRCGSVAYYRYAPSPRLVLLASKTKNTLQVGVLYVGNTALRLGCVLSTSELNTYGVRELQGKALR